MLHAYRLKMQRAASDQYADEVQLWALIAPHAKRPPEPPPLPSILKD